MFKKLYKQKYDNIGASPALKQKTLELMKKTLQRSLHENTVGVTVSEQRKESIIKSLFDPDGRDIDA